MQSTEWRRASAGGWVPDAERPASAQERAPNARDGGSRRGVDVSSGESQDRPAEGDALRVQYLHHDLGVRYAEGLASVAMDRIYDLVVVSGFQAYDDVYRDIPESERPAKP